MTLTQERLLTIRDVATRLNVSPEAVRRMLRDGRLRGLKLGTSKTEPWRVDPSDLENFIARGRRAARRQS